MTPHPTNIIPKQHYYATNTTTNLVMSTKQHCIRVKKLLNLGSERTSVIYMRGKTEDTRDSTDVELEFRQESYFYYLTGVDEPGFHVVVDLKQERVYLIAPSVLDDDIFWKGPHHDVNELLERYDVDEIIFESDLSQLFYELNPDEILVTDQQHANDLAELIPSVKCLAFDTQLLKPTMNEARLIKFPWEIDMIRQVMYGSSEAHIALMQQFRPGMTEAYLAALFRWTCAQYEIYKQAYLPIIASGPRAATLHYSKNNQRIPNGPHAMVLVDAGGEKSCYSSDITRTFPVRGQFSETAKTIYNIVLKMQEAVLSKLKPGVYWTDMQHLAVRVLCDELIRIGILVNGTLEELVQRNVTTAFYYHGLGHALGLDVHDVGGKDKPQSIEEENPIISNFLVDRPLESNMVLTVEPGVYFNDAMLKIWTQYPGYQKYFDLEMIKKYRHVGGVRIEDTIVITEDGYENLTHAPKQPHEIEALMTYFHT